MRRLFYDLETSGLYHLHDDILQLAYALYEDNVCKKTGMFYFWYDGCTWSEEAYKVNKLSKEFLNEYKEEFNDNCIRSYVALSGIPLVGFNNHIFDDNFIQSWFSRVGMPSPVIQESIDVMELAGKKYGLKRISLKNTRSRLGITDETVKEYCRKIFNCEAEAHDARYDVTATMLCYFKLMRSGDYIPDEIKNDSANDSAAAMDLATNILGTYATDYEPDCKWFHVGDLWYPTCSDTNLFSDKPLPEPPEGAKVEDKYVFPAFEGEYGTTSIQVNDLIGTFTHSKDSTVIEYSFKF